MAMIVAFAVSASVASPPHPIHTTMTAVDVDATHRAVTLSIRVFADDFASVVARAAGRAAPADSSVRADEVTRYVRANVAIAGATLEPCGIRRVGDAFMLCFRATLVSAPAATTIRNSMLTELHADQVNIVQVQYERTRHTHLFTKGAGARPLLS